MPAPCTHRTTCGPPWCNQWMEACQGTPCFWYTPRESRYLYCDQGLLNLIAGTERAMGIIRTRMREARRAATVTTREAALQDAFEWAQAGGMAEDQARTAILEAWGR